MREVITTCTTRPPHPSLMAVEPAELASARPCRAASAGCCHHRSVIKSISAQPPRPSPVLSFEMLPSDCIASLLRHLPTPDLARTGLACRQHHEAVASVLRLRIKESGLYLPPVLPQSPTATMNLLLRLEQGRADAQGRAAAHAAARAAALETGRQERLAALHRLETAILARLKQWCRAISPHHASPRAAHLSHTPPNRRRASGPAPPGVAFRITDGFGIIQRLRDEREDDERRASLAAAATMRSRRASRRRETREPSSDSIPRASSPPHPSPHRDLHLRLMTHATPCSRTAGSRLSKLSMRRSSRRATGASWTSRSFSRRSGETSAASARGWRMQL